MITHKIDYILNKAIRKANVLRHEYLTLENILFAALDDEVVQAIVELCGGNVEEMKDELKDFLEGSDHLSILSEEDIKTLGDEQFVDEKLRALAFESGIAYQPELSLALERVLQSAAIHVQSAGKNEITGENLFVALFDEEESFAVYTIRKQGIERFDVIQAIAHGLDDVMEDREDENFGEFTSEEKTKKKRSSALDEFAINLNELAKNNQIDPIIGREKEIKRIIQILCRRRKNNPLLVGEAGVGKTALAEGLAWSIANGKSPEVLADSTIYALDMASLLAGAKFRGEFEDRLKRVIKELQEKNESGNYSILFIDEIHTVMGAGATGEGSLDASNLLKPALSSGKLKCMGSTTYDEYRKFIEKNSAFGRRFQKVDIGEPSDEDTFKILQGLRSRFEEHHQVHYSDKILKNAISLANRYLLDRKNPDKALDIIDEAGAKIQVLPEGKRKRNITLKDIEEVVATIAMVPKLTTSSDDKIKFEALESHLKMLLFGQNKAVEQVSNAILMARSGLSAEDRPEASFLFAGPTGVGKTELAKQLARKLEIPLHRFDMSEYMEKHSVSKLIGAPPGYIGHGEGGGLTDKIKKSPHCILLLDEIEKAHQDILNILLQVMDRGILTDSQGRETSFKNVILIMTTNAGATEMSQGSIGLNEASGSSAAKRDQVVKRFFSPEFRNRLDDIIYFEPLATKSIIHIVEKFILELEAVLAKKSIELIITNDVKKWLALKGHDSKLGARPISRLIDNEIKKPLSKEILFGRLVKGGKAIISLNNKIISDSKIIINYS